MYTCYIIMRTNDPTSQNLNFPFMCFRVSRDWPTPTSRKLTCPFWQLWWIWTCHRLPALSERLLSFHWVQSFILQERVWDKIMANYSSPLVYWELVKLTSRREFNIFSSLSTHLSSVALPSSVRVVDTPAAAVRGNEAFWWNKFTFHVPSPIIFQ